jgi:hypothetical protein
MYFDVKGNISCLMILSFYVYSLSCITMAWSWTKLGVDTIRYLINIFMKVYWLWLDFLDICDWYANGDVPHKAYSFDS